MSSYQVVIQGCALIGFWGAFAANASIDNISDLQWQIPVAVQLVPGILLFLGTLYIKETPHYLAAKGDLEKVEVALSWFRGLPTSDEEVRYEAGEISATVRSGIHRQTIRKTPFVREALRNPTRRRLFTGVGLHIAQNLSGMNALNYYVAIIFMTAGFNSISVSLFLTGIFGLVKVVAALLFMFVCVRIYGNRFWLLWGQGTCAISMFVVGYCVATMPESVGDGSTTNVRSYLAVLGVYV